MLDLRIVDQIFNKRIYMNLPNSSMDPPQVLLHLKKNCLHNLIIA